MLINLRVGMRNEGRSATCHGASHGALHSRCAPAQPLPLPSREFARASQRGHAGDVWRDEPHRRHREPLGHHPRKPGGLQRWQRVPSQVAPVC